MHDPAQSPQESHLPGSTLMPPEMVIACRGHFLAHIPHSVHISARIRAFAAVSNSFLAFLASGAVTEICPPPNSLAFPAGVRRSAISYSGEYLASPAVLRASWT